jgi:threonyl-tRNA synthetase
VEDQSSQLAKMKHSLAHIMANAVQHKWPEAKFGVGPAVSDGFYYDIDLGDKTISEEDFTEVEAEMKKIIQANQPFERSEKSIDDALAWAKTSNQPYKEELLNDLKRAGTTSLKDLDPETLGTETNDGSQVAAVSFYKNGDFEDLCRGPHVASTGEVGAFKLYRVSGVYWRGNEKNRQMQRLHGLAFASEKELAEHMLMLEEAQKRDHRKLGKELDLFVFSDLVGAGLPLFHITKQELYEKSGHWDKFGDQLFLVKSQETSDNFVLKPMNCPHHTQIYAGRPRSYKELPIRYMESTVQYRDEKKGELNGLSRVRSISIDDSHIFCSVDQIEQEFKTILDMIKEMYSVLGMKFRARLSFRDDSEGYLGDKAIWDQAQAVIEKTAKEAGLEYFIQEGEAAFYGPKIDILVTDALGREWQCATEQLDFVQPQRFDLTYTDSDGSEKQPVMIHKALLGSFERFLAVYIEHTAGRFPVWLSPEQIRLITVNQEQATVDFAQTVCSKAKELGLRLYLDNSNESVGKKIRNSELAKVPYTIVVGEKEIASNEVAPRIRKDMSVMDVVITIGVEEFLKTVANEAKSRVLKTSL